MRGRGFRWSRAGIWPLLLVTLGLTVTGILFVHSATSDGEAFPSRQARSEMVKAFVGCLALLIFWRIDYRWLERHAYTIYGAVLGVLALMLVAKVASGGRNRFIELPYFQIQPSEVMKMALVLGLARYLRFREDQRSPVGWIGPSAMTLVPMALVLLQPNLGLSLMFPPIFFGMLFVSGARARHLLLTLLVGVAAVIGAYAQGDKLPLLKDYQRDRFKAFFSRDDSLESAEGLQLHQALIAIGSAGVLGKGYGEGPQNRQGYVPEKETDFIFTVVAEETGFVGAALLVLGCFALVALILRVALQTREPFARLVATGIATAFGAQFFENLGMTCGITPITGVALPFISLAGSTLVMSLAAVGLVLGIAVRPVRVVAPKDLDPQAPRRAHPLFDGRPGGSLEARWPTA